MVKYCKCGCGNKISRNATWVRGHFLLGRTLKEVWGNKANNIIKRRAAKLKGKTYEEIYGKKRGKEKRKEQSVRQTGKKLNRKKPSYKKGLKYNKIYGKNKAKIIIDKIKKSNIKNGQYWTKKNILEAYKNIPNIRKSELRKYRKKRLMPDSNTIRRYFRNLDKMAIQANKLFLQPIYKVSGIGQNEKLILDNIEKEKNIKLKRQYKVGRYYVDGYDIDNNVVYEVDEEYYHNYNKEEDFIREEKIKNILYCNFVRINEQEFLLKFNNHIIEDFIER